MFGIFDMSNFVENVFEIKKNMCTEEPEHVVSVNATPKAVQRITTVVENQKVVMKNKVSDTSLKEDDNIKSMDLMLCPPQKRIAITGIFQKILLMVTHILIHILKGLGYARI
jgi:hypothetical protein